MPFELPEFPDLPSISDILKIDPDYLDRPLDTQETADWLGYTPQHVKLMRRRGTGPRFLKLPSGKIAYTRRLLFPFIWSGGEHKSTTADNVSNASEREGTPADAGNGLVYAGG